MPHDAATLDELTRACETIGIALQPLQLQRLLDHLALLTKWNKVYNLTAVRDPAQMLHQHLIDSLTTIAPLRRHLRSAAGVRVLDVGSGAGFPGLTIAIAIPQSVVTCVDSVGKKVGFIRQVAAELGLDNLRAEHARIESLPPLNCNVITSRAFASLADFVALTRQHLAPGGVWMAMKGRRPDDEIDALPEEIDMFHVEQLDPPGLDAQRCLVWMRPAAGDSSPSA